MILNLKKYVLSIIYKLNNCSLNVDPDFWGDLVDLDLEEVSVNV